MDAAAFGKWVFRAGAFVALVGGTVWLGARLGLPLGRLPGDIHVEGEHSSFHFPIVTCLLISITVSLVLTLIHLLRR